MYVCIYVSMLMHVCFFVCIYVCMYVCMYVCVCMHMYVHVYIYVNMNEMVCECAFEDFTAIRCIQINVKVSTERIKLEHEIIIYYNIFRG